MGPGRKPRRPVFSERGSYGVTTGRCIPFPLLPKVQEEFEQMLAKGIIEQVPELTDWCVDLILLTVDKNHEKNENLLLCRK